LSDRVKAMDRLGGHVSKKNVQTILRRQLVCKSLIINLWLKTGWKALRLFKHSEN